jgi:hypothetical protein
MTIFLSIISIEGLKGGPSAFFKLISNPTQYIGNVGILLILMFFVTYGFAVIKDFILPQKYKTVSMAETMFSPYGRIFVQQFVVIIGSFILLFNASKIFILIFVITKIFFELLVRFDKLKMLSKKISLLIFYILLITHLHLLKLYQQFHKQVHRQYLPFELIILYLSKCYKLL